MTREKPKKKSSISAEPELVPAHSLCAQHIGQDVSVTGRKAGMLGELESTVKVHTGVLQSVHMNAARVRVVLSASPSSTLSMARIVEVTE